MAARHDTNKGGILSPGLLIVMLLMWFFMIEVVDAVLYLFAEFGSVKFTAL